MTKIVATLPDGKICDYIDQKIRNDTPEEYVRQNIERRLALELGYSRDQIEVEFPHKDRQREAPNRLNKRNEDGELIPSPSGDRDQTELFEPTANGDVTKRPIARQKILDDDSPGVAKEFLDWKRTAVLGW